MPETIGQHNIAAITAPVNGQPQDANVVRGNDNTIRGGHNNHDNDSGIHVQSSTFALRPAAGAAGRKWVTTDGGRFELWFDDGARWHHVASNFLTVDAIADATLTAGDVVKVTGFNVGQQLPRVNLTASASDVAFGIVLRDAAPGGIATVINTGLVSPVDTNGYAEGTILYSDGAGGLTVTQPASGLYQACALVLRGSSSTGAVYVEFSEPRTVEATTATANTLVKRDGSGNIAAAAISASGAVSAASVTASGAIAGASLSGSLPASDVQPGTFPNGTFTAQNVTVTGTLTAANIAAVAASAVTAGTFGAGNYTFPDNVTVNDSFTVDSSGPAPVFFVNHTNNRVGINIAAPTTTLDVAGNVLINGSLTAGSLVLPSSDPLTEYQDDTWTPNHDTGITNTTVTPIFARYVKVGRAVHVQAEISVSSTDAVQAVIIGLPVGLTGAEQRLTVQLAAGAISLSGSDPTSWERAFGEVDQDGKITLWRYVGNGGSPSTLLWTECDSRQISISGTYIANA
jgi:hypothetical protein